MFELFGIQAVTTSGHSVALPAPLSDVNGAIMMGCTSYLFIVLGGILNNGVGGLGGALKEFSLPISMSFRLFGALVSGAIVTELVYHYMGLSYVLPVIIGVLFTCLHALIQAYVLTMLVALFYGEVSEPPKPRQKKLSKLSRPKRKTSHRLHRIFRRKIKMNKTLRFVSILAHGRRFVVLGHQLHERHKLRLCRHGRRRG